MPITCTDHRISLLLQAINRRLAGEEMAPEERRQLEEEAARLETALGLD